MNRWLGFALLLAWLCLSATGDAGPTTDIPKELAVPPGHKLTAKLRARGVQIYKAVKGKSGGVEWTLEGPLADLSTDRGAKAGCHYEGPAWEASDGSKVVRDPAVAVKSVPAPSPKADIPWLLLKVKAADATPGKFARVVYVQRLNTAGGMAPAGAPKRVGTKVGVAYTAVYQLWSKAE
jgi:hypothetical protein